MPRSRGSDIPQRQSLRGPHPLRTSSADSDPLHHRPITDRSPKLGDRRSPKGTQLDPLNQKKLGTRIADLESQLGQAQGELKLLKDQLALAEAAKKEAQQELEKKVKKPAAPAPEPEKVFEKTDRRCADEGFDENQQETDVFEVPVEPKFDPVHQIDLLETEAGQIEISAEPLSISEPEKPSFDELALKDNEINTLKGKLEEKEKELGVFRNENEKLKNQLNEANLSISSAKAKEEEMHARIRQLGEELEAKKANAAKLEEKVETAEEVKEALEAEMKKMRVQTEQWRKAADAAAAVLAGGVEMNGRMPERCGSMDKHLGGVLEASAGGYSGFVGSPGMADEMEYGYGGGKRKGSGKKMFGDLWKRKGHK